MHVGPYNIKKSEARPPAKDRVAFMITTYDRTESCKALVERIAPLGDVYIYNDGSQQNYAWAMKYHYKVGHINGGKKWYWRAVSFLWLMVRPNRTKYKYFIMLPDDFIPESNFLEKAIRTWKSIPDRKKICLNLYVDKGRLNLPCWTGVLPEVFPEARKIQWVDMCFLSEKRFFDVLGWGVPKISERWHLFPARGSGVGAAISRKLHGAGYTMWQTHTSMFLPSPEALKSKLNGHRNIKEAMINIIVPGTITAQIASLPDREHLLKKTVESLRPQVDKIFVGLNSYTHTPDFLKEGEYIHLDNSTGDAAKFYGVEGLAGYLLTCDDDIIYPPDYVQYMISGLHKHGAITTLHGKVYPRPATSFIKTVAKVRCLDACPCDTEVDVPGTGVTCLHTDMIKVRYEDFKIRNMADLWLAKLAHEQGVKIMALAHPADYLTYQPPPTTIWQDELLKGFTTQNKIVREIFKRQEHDKEISLQGY